MLLCNNQREREKKQKLFKFMEFQVFLFVHTYYVAFLVHNNKKKFRKKYIVLMA